MTILDVPTIYPTVEDTDHMGVREIIYANILRFISPGTMEEAGLVMNAAYISAAELTGILISLKVKGSNRFKKELMKEVIGRRQVCEFLSIGEVFKVMAFRHNFYETLSLQARIIMAMKETVARLERYSTGFYTFKWLLQENAAEI